MKIYVIKAFSCVFQYCWEKNYLFLFPSKTHKNFPSREDKIGWFPSQLQSEKPASRRTTIFYIVRQHDRGKRPQIDPSVGRNPPYFFKFPHQSMLGMLENIINSKTNSSVVANFPTSSLEYLLFCQPARFLWGTDKVRNRFVGCPWIEWLTRTVAKNPF